MVNSLAVPHNTQHRVTMVTGYHDTPKTWCLTLATPWTITHQISLSMGFPGKNTGVGCYFLLQGNIPNLWIELRSPCIACGLLCWQADSLPTKPLYNPTISCWGIYPKELNTYVWKTYIWIFVAALFIRVKKWKWPKCISTDEWRNNMFYGCKMECHLAIKENTDTCYMTYATMIRPWKYAIWKKL